MGRVLAALLIAAFTLVFPLTTYADGDHVIMASQQITITAKVLPARYIVLDENEQIRKIISNTDEDVSPQVYKDSVKVGNETVANPQALAQYQKIIDSAPQKIGVIYDAGKVQTDVTYSAPTRTSRLSFLSLLHIRSLYRF